jgi:predicted Zn-dependent protease with MMP-like domain
VTGAGPGSRPRRRDRHGRGLRGPLAPPEVPISRSRAERFDDLVRDAVEHLEERWPRELAGVEFAVEEVPPDDEPDPDDADPVPLGRVLPAEGRTPPYVVVYRRPIQARAADPLDLADLVHDVVVEQVARLLGIDPDVLDPPYDGEG